MGNIILLDDLTINKIAAGEVIERPASAVKELVENSIDAGATTITVEIKNGGISYIRVTDNGKGLLPDDMEIAFERHATSKIRVAQDIETIRSMGFRGEALASIAAISRITMKSKTEQNYAGNQIIIEGGKVIAKGEIGCSNGTSITIENLFFNTPVRYKFLKKDFTEASYIEDTIARIALAHPEISIKYINTGKTIISTSGNGDIKAVIYAIYGRNIAENIINVDYEYENIKITGVVGKPEIARSNRSNQIFFINKRYIKDKVLAVASELAYKDLIPTGKYGFLILNLELDPAKVDVNVHPAKLEVRFQEESNVYKAVYNAIKNALGNFDNIRQEIKKQSSDWNIGTQAKYREYVAVSNNIENKIGDEWKNSINGIEREENKEQRGFLKKLLARKEKEQEPTIVEQLYEARKQEPSQIDEYASNFNKIMQKMAEMQKNVREFNESQAASTNKEKIENRFNETKIEEYKDNVNEQSDKQEIGLVNEHKIQQELELVNEQSAEQELEHTQANELRTEQNLKFINEQSIDQKAESENQLCTEQELTLVNYPSAEQELAQTNESSAEQELAQTNESSNEQELAQTNESSAEQELVQTNEPNNEQEQTQEYAANEELELQKEYNTRITQENVTNNQQDNFDEMYATIFGAKPKSTTVIQVNEEPETYTIQETQELTNENLSLFEPIEEGSNQKYKYIGIAFDNYLVIEIDKELYILDQIAANEKIIYEELKREYEDNKEIHTQIMLLPDVINLTAKQMLIVEDNKEIFKKAGFMLEQFGQNTIKLTGAPNICENLDTEELFLKILEQINKVARTDRQAIEQKFLTTIASTIAQNSILANTPEDVEQLMKELLRQPNAFTIGSEKQVAMRLTKSEIEKKFSRR